MSKATANSTYLHLKMDVAFVPEREYSGRARQLVKRGGGGGEEGGGASCIAKWQRTKPKLRLKTIINT